MAANEIRLKEREFMLFHPFPAHDSALFCVYQCIPTLGFNIQNGFCVYFIHSVCGNFQEIPIFPPACPSLLHLLQKTRIPKGFYKIIIRPHIVGLQNMVQKRGQEHNSHLRIHLTDAAAISMPFIRANGISRKIKSISKG